MRKLTKDDPLTVKAAEMYKSGATLKEAAAKVFISSEALRNRFKNAGIDRRAIKNQKLKPDKIAELRSDRAAGLKVTEIAKKRGVSISAVSRYTQDITRAIKKREL